MKRKVAIYANGWSTDFLKKVLQGIRMKAKEKNVDIFLFLSYAEVGAEDAENYGESNIYNLPDPDDFDAFITAPTSFNYPTAIEELANRLKNVNKPIVSIEGKLGIHDVFCGTDYDNMTDELAKHLLKDHHVKNVLYISGNENAIEGDERLAAIREMFQKEGLDIPAEAVLCGRWSHHGAIKALEQWYQEGIKLPDAIICGNDMMAIGTCAFLDAHNISIPEDVLVTGCDHVSASDTYYPSITTIDTGRNDLGREALTYVLDMLDGKKPFMPKIKPRLIKAESCGCGKAISAKEREKTLGRLRNQEYLEMLASILQSGYYSEMSLQMGKVAKQNDIPEIMGAFLKRDRQFLCENFGIYVNYDSFNFTEDHLRMKGYDKHVMRLFGLKHGEFEGTTTITSRQMMADYDPDSKEAQCYLFLPLHMSRESIGYVVIRDEFERIYDYSMFTLLRQLNQGVTNIRRNLKMRAMQNELLELSEKDSLTGIYNRTAYDRVAVPMLKLCKKRKVTAVLMVADIDRMKEINDQYGHLQGDLAIRVAAYILSNTLPKDWVVIRYGGDEFYIVGECGSRELAQNYIQKITEELKAYILKASLEFPLTISLGVSMIEPEDKTDIKEHFRIADKEMYEMKESRHVNRR